MNDTINREDKIDAYLDSINRYVLPYVDYSKLNDSYFSKDKKYVKRTLASLHQAFVKTYGDVYVSEYSCGEMVVAPAVIKAKNSGELCVGFVTLELSASGEHWGTEFLTEYGVIPDNETKREELCVRIDRFVPYEYWYTIILERDIHVDFDKVPQDVAKLLDACDTAQAIGPPSRKRSKPKER
jgi:hypothetical protein